METKETLVVMDTTLGKIKFKLYNDTPQHRDNFIKLAKAGQYDGLLFHRINYTIYNLAAFMDGDIQDCIDHLIVAENAERLKESEL